MFCFVLFLHSNGVLDDESDAIDVFSGRNCFFCHDVLVTLLFALLLPHDVRLLFFPSTLLAAAICLLLLLP